MTQMSRKRMFALLIATAVLVLCASPLAAQESKVMWNLGAGGVFPVRDSGPSLNVGWSANGGLGWRFMPNFGILGEFTYNHLSLTDATLASFGVPDGSTRVLGFTANPTVRMNPWGPVDFYLIGGGGIYRREVEFTQPTVGFFTAFDPFLGVFYPVAVPANQVIASSSTWKGGLNIGGGLTFRLGSRDTKLYVESRYHHVYTQPVATNILPLTIGLRW